MPDKIKVVLGQLGSPKDPTVKSVRPYLKEFLSDPRVVDLNPIAWKIILNCFILPFRPKRSAEAYSRIWDGESFPLITLTEKFAKKVAKNLEDVPEDIEVNHAFLLSSPRIPDIWDEWEKEDTRTRASKILAIPLFPQYSSATVASVIDSFGGVAGGRTQIPSFEFITHFHQTKAFIDNSVRLINETLDNEKKAGRHIDGLIISFHGMQLRRILIDKDPYYRHCFETFYLLRERIKDLDAEDIYFTFQSRFGSEQWIGPYMDEFAIEKVKSGKKRLAAYCPSFVADCLETVDEIGTELHEEVQEFGGEIIHVPCLNDDDQWCEDFATLIKTKVMGTKPELESLSYSVPKEAYVEMPEQELKSPPLSPHAKKTLKLVFLTLFMDLVGFSIIFPLFPALAKYYLSVDSENFFLKAIFSGVSSLLSAGGQEGLTTQGIVLFGGALGALYSFLQFLAAPLWGGISDRIGRRPVLLISVAFLALSYLLWFFSGSFTLLIAARFIGGIMGGNISTATAVVADVTTAKNRSKGMATIGIAFALGFIIGPTIGGVLSSIDLTAMAPSLKEFGVNPFSAPAALAFVLSAWNFVWLYRKFEETLPPEKRGKSVGHRKINPLALFKPLPYKGVNLTNFGYFLFLVAFSGMEFTLTFLAVERLSYSSLDNGLMFLFIGIVLAFVQGGFVRRKASTIGEKKVALTGMVTLVPGLVLIALANSSWALYSGLFFLAAGSAMIIPCLTTLVSLYSPAEEQGRAIGVFRSLGALARVFGPIAASLLYWKQGASAPYLIGAAFLIVPILLIGKLPSVEKEA